MFSFRQLQCKNHYICSVKSNEPIKFDIDHVCELIIDGKTFREIAKVYDCSISTLHNFLVKPEHAVRTRDALELSAATYANKGEQVLIEAEAISVEIQRARELAQHYRWMAAKRSPKKYGEKVDVTSGGETIKQTFVVNGKEIEF